MEEEKEYLKERMSRIDRHIEYDDLERERVGTGFVGSGEKRNKKEKETLQKLLNILAKEFN